ncbi:MAG: prephenate dehydratase [Endomicrobium sp.]|jgi:chorismate mutase/prephenate dehydratase|nr:prephenate dehydratase [Endomicrobium sp.]
MLINKLNGKRKAIDRIDKDIVKLINKRAQIALEVGKVKKEKGAVVYSPSREKEVFRQILSLKNTVKEDDLMAIYSEIISACRNLETTTKIAFLGPWATFTHQAAIRKFGSSAIFVPCAVIADVFDEVEKARADFGVVPIENSNEGSVNVTLDLLVDSELSICGEISLKIEQCFLAKEPKNKILRVYSHPQALAQCRNWLSANYPDIEVIPVSSTAEAAKKVSKESFSVAIASEAAAKIYNLYPLAKGIQDGAQNFTRFLIIGKTKTNSSGQDKISLALMIKDKVGALYNLLGVFGKNGVNLTRIESRPSKKKLWEYIFFIDIEGHIEDKKIISTIEKVKKHCVFVKVLGAYPKF